MLSLKKKIYLQNTTNVRAGLIVSAESPMVLQIIGLGSCIAIAFYSQELTFGSFAHVMLPSKFGAKTPEMKGKYADTAIPELLSVFKKKKIKIKDIKVKLVGGSSMFSSTSKDKNNIATRNINAIKKIIKESNLSISSEHLGGSHGRSVYFHLDTGKIQIFYGGNLIKEI